MTNDKFCPTYYNIGNRAVAFSTTREGGVGAGNYASFNINAFCGDSADNIAANLQILANQLGIDSDHIIMPHQTHGVETRIIAPEFMSLPANVRGMLLEGVDAVMTDTCGICIGVSTADCIPVLLYDEEHNAVCAIHAGWRGTLARIAHKAAVEMGMAFHSDPKKLKAVIGPGISRKNFEVGDDVYSAFEEAAFDMGTVATQEIKRNPNATDPAKAFEKKWHIDLPLCNRMQLEHVGLLPENIYDAAICTYDNADTYFSARRLGTDSGRIFTGIMLKG